MQVCPWKCGCPGTPEWGFTSPAAGVPDSWELHLGPLLGQYVFLMTEPSARVLLSDQGHLLQRVHPLPQSPPSSSSCVAELSAWDEGAVIGTANQNKTPSHPPSSCLALTNQVAIHPWGQ